MYVRKSVSLGVGVVLLATVIMVSVPVTASEYGDGWEVPVLLDAATSVNAGDPIVGMDSNGNAIAVWIQPDGVWFNRYVNGYGWGNALEIDGTMSGSTPAASIDLAVLKNGYAWLAFGLVGNIYATLYQPGVGWHPAALIENLGDICRDPQIASDGEYTYVVWKRAIGEYVPDAVFANVKMPGASWDNTACVRIDEGSGATLYGLYNSPLDLAAGGIGNATVVWSQYRYTSSVYNVYASRFVSDSWQDQKLIDYSDDDHAITPRVAADCNNNAIAVWVQTVSGSTNIYSNVFLSSKNRWYTETEFMDLLEQESGVASSPRVAMNDNGIAVAVWRQDQGSYYDIWSNRYVLGDRWGSANASIIDDLDTNAGSPDVAVDNAGNAVAVWPQTYWSKYDIVASVYNQEVGSWLTAHIIEDQRVDSYARGVGAAICDIGSAIAVWRGSDGSFMSVYANRYVFSDDTPPELELYSPEDGAETTIPVIRVSGATEPDASLSIGGFLASVNPDSGEFSISLPLIEGENTIAVVATDSAGNENSVVITVDFSNPIPALEAEILVIQATIDDVYEELADVWSAIDDITDDVAEVWNQLSETMEILDGQISLLNDAVAELEALQNEVDNLRDDLATVEDDSDATATTLEAAVAELDALAALLDKTCERLAVACAQANETEDALVEAMESIDVVEGDTDSLSTTALLLGVLAAVALVLSSVLAVLYMGLRKKIGGGRTE